MWTHDDTQFLIENYRELGANKCSEILNRTKTSVRNKASRLGLKSEVKKSGKDKYLVWLNTSEFELVEEFNLTSTPTLHRHIVCGYEWKVRPNNLMTKASSCPNCGKLSKHTDETYLQRLNDTGFEVLEPIEGVNQKILHKHTVCGHEWLVRPSDILSGQNCPKCSKRNYSKIAIEWLNSFNNPNILHAENGGEQSIAGYKVDGYDPFTNTVYEFHGDAYHGNLELYNPEDTCHPFDKTTTADQLFDKTAEKMIDLSKLANVIYIWESDYKRGFKYEQFT